MSQVAFIVTRKVKHLATWTQDTKQGDHWPSGNYRPICGGARTHLRHGKPTIRLVYPEPNFPYEDTTFVFEASRRPLCKSCRRTVDALVHTATSDPS